MIHLPTLISVIEVLLVTVPVLMTVAYVTVAERKTMASMQRRLGPNIVGYYGLLQAFADALKLLLKEYVSPTQANLVLFFLGPIITLIFSLLGYAVLLSEPKKAYLLLALQPANNIPYVAKDETANMYNKPKFKSLIAKPGPYGITA